MLVSYGNIYLNSLYTCNGSTILYVAYTVYPEHKITSEGEFIFERCVLDLITRMVWAVTLCTFWSAKKAVSAPPGFFPGIVA